CWPPVGANGPSSAPDTCGAPRWRQSSWLLLNAVRRCRIEEMQGRLAEGQFHRLVGVQADAFAQHAGELMAAELDGQMRLGSGRLHHDHLCRRSVLAVEIDVFRPD